MRTFRAPLWNVALLLSMLPGSLVSNSIAADELPAIDVPDILAALDSYSASLTTLEGTSESSLKSRSEKVTGGLRMENLRFKDRFQVDLTRNCWNIERTKSWTYSAISPSESFSQFQRDAFDGQRTCSLVYTFSELPASVASPETKNLPHRLRISSGHPRVVELFPWVNARWNGRRSHSFIADELRRSGVTDIRTETIAGSPCYLVRSGDSAEFALDPARAYLPRRIRWSRESLLSGVTYENLAFDQFSDQDGSQTQWFPTHGRFETSFNVHEFRILTLRLNAKFDPETFRINPADLPPGVAVADESQSPPHRSITGDRQDLWDERQQKLEEQSQKFESLLHVGPPAKAKK